MRKVRKLLGRQATGLDTFYKQMVDGYSGKVFL